MSQELSMGGLVEKSRYFKRFQNLERKAPQAMVIEGDLVIVEALEKLEKSVMLGDKKLIIADAKGYKQGHNEKVMEFGLVVKVGPGDVLDGERIEMPVKVGDVVVLPGNVAWYSQFATMMNYEPYTLGVTRASSLIIKFPEPQVAMDVLNEQVE